MPCAAGNKTWPTDLRNEDAQLRSFAPANVEAQLRPGRFFQDDGARKKLSKFVVVIWVVDSLK